MSAELEVPAVTELYCPTCERTFAAGERCADDNTRLVRIAKSGDRLIGRELDGRYTIVEKLGEGAMGIVYRGTQHSVGREVAIKVVTPSLVSEPMVIKRFLREAKLASRLSHPNAVSVLDFGQTEDGLFYLIMELVEGRTLDKVIESGGPLPAVRLVRIGAQICDALEGAHRLQIVHRDLKPANVMMLAASRDLVKVLDFGLAKSLTPLASMATMTNAGALLGTPAFMPPELVSGGETDARADLYSLGCVLHYAASGQLPFVAGSVHELIAMHATETPPPLPRIPVALGRAIAKLLAKSPSDRYPSAAATREALEAALDGGAIVEAPRAETAPVTGPTTVLGWTGTVSVPGRPLTPPAGTPLVARAATKRDRIDTPSGSRPLEQRVAAAQRAATPASGVAISRTPTPVGNARLPPAERAAMSSSPTLVATLDEIKVVVPPQRRTKPSRAPVLIGAAAVIAGALVAFLAVRGTDDDDKAERAEPTPPPVIAPAKAAAPEPAPTPPPSPAVAPTPPAPVVEAAPPPQVPAATPPKKAPAKRPVKRPKREPERPIIRINPGVM